MRGTLVRLRVWAVHLSRELLALLLESSEKIFQGNAFLLPNPLDFLNEGRDGGHHRAHHEHAIPQVHKMQRVTLFNAVLFSNFLRKCDDSLFPDLYRLAC